MNLPKVQAVIAYIVVAIFFAWLGYQIYTAWLNKVILYLTNQE